MSQTQQEPARTTQNLTVFEGFQGLQTQPSRYGIDEKQCFIMDGFFPAGNDNARVIPDNGAAVATFDAGTSFFGFANIGVTPYSVVFLSDGSIDSLNTATGVVNQIAPPGTILNPSQGNVALTQWGSLYVLIVANQPNGYFLWDGVAFYSAGQTVPGIDGPGPIVSSVLSGGGSGYTVGDTGTVTGGINDAAYIITSVNAAGDGVGYATGDTGTILTGSMNAAYVVNTVDGSGAVTSASLTNAGSGYVTANNVGTATGGFQPGIGTGLTFDITAATPGGPITAFTLTATGVVTGYTLTSDGTLYLPGTAGTATGGAQPGAGVGLVLILTVTSATMPTGIQGNAIETFQSYVWIGNGDTLIWSAPGSPVDFSTSGGGGSLTSNDSSLRVTYEQLTQSNGYLYLFGDSSISYVAGVQTTGSPPTTSFSLQNVDPEVGTPWPNTVNVLGSNIIFGNPWGAHVSFGGRAAKVSSELDGIYNTAPNFSGIIPSSAKAILFGKRIWVLLLPVIDQVTGQLVNKLFLWDEKRWCSTQQSAALVFLAAQEINSVLTAWGTDGTSLYRLFQNPTTNLTKTLQSKFWAPLTYARVAAENRVWGIVQIHSGPPTLISISIDSENGSAPVSFAIASPAVTWINDSDAVVEWINNSSDTVEWTSTSGGSGLIVLPPNNCSQNGALVGITLSTNAQDLAIISLATMPVDVQYRG